MKQIISFAMCVGSNFRFLIILKSGEDVKFPMKTDITLGNLKTGESQPSSKQSSLNICINILLAASVCLAMLVYTLPIFGNRLYVSNGIYDFGTIKSGTKINHKFTLRNLHPWSIVVTDTHSDCGCTDSFTGQAPPFTLKPFQSVEVNATVETGGRRAGEQASTIYVITQDNKQGNQLLLHGKLQ